jgi:hypothetical protein
LRAKGSDGTEPLGWLALSGLELPTELLRQHGVKALRNPGFWSSVEALSRAATDPPTWKSGRADFRTSQAAKAELEKTFRELTRRRKSSEPFRAERTLYEVEKLRADGLLEKEAVRRVRKAQKRSADQVRADLRRARKERREEVKPNL